MTSDFEMFGWKELTCAPSYSAKTVRYLCTFRCFRELHKNRISNKQHNHITHPKLGLSCSIQFQEEQVIRFSSLHLSYFYIFNPFLFHLTLFFRVDGSFCQTTLRRALQISSVKIKPFQLVFSIRNWSIILIVHNTPSRRFSEASSSFQTC